VCDDLTLTREGGAREGADRMLRQQPRAAVLC
jgi:hypothetical protein